MASRGHSKTFLVISTLRPQIMRDDWKPLKETINKKIPQNALQASVWLWRKVRSRIRRSTGKRTVKQEYKIWVWGKKQHGWYPLQQSPTEFMRGKKAVAAQGGRGGRRALKTIEDFGIEHWKKTSRPGEGPLSHPSDVPGWHDYWLRESVFWSKEDAQKKGTLLIYVDEKLGGKNIRPILRALEFGGPISVNEKWTIGYYASSIRSGYKTTGTADWKHNWKRTLRAHKRKFRVPHVTLTRRWEKQSFRKVIDARPIMAPVQAAFFRDFFPELYQKHFLK